MSRTVRIAMTAARYARRVAMGLVAVLVLFVLFAPSLRPEARRGEEPDALEPLESTFALVSAEADPAKTVTITDEAGRRLAEVGRWINGEISVIARHDSGPTVSVWFSSDGHTVLELGGAERKTTIEMAPDGTTKSRENGIRRRGS
jgi:hypothetical protein